MYVSVHQIKNTIGRQVKPYWSSGSKYAGFSDSRYYLWHMNVMQEYLDNNPIEGAPGLGEGFDCDDYSFILKGNLSLLNRNRLGLRSSLGLGIAWGRFMWINEFHACNWFLDTHGQFHWIEPQNGKILALDQCITGSLTLLLI